MAFDLRVGAAYDNNYVAPKTIPTPTTNTNSVATVKSTQPTDTLSPAFANALQQGGATYTGSGGEKFVTPIVSANSAIDHYLNAKSTLDNANTAMTGQALMISQERAQAAKDAAKTQSKEVKTGQETSNNTDLVKALGDATKALTPEEQAKNAFDITTDNLEKQNKEIEDQIQKSNTDRDTALMTFQNTLGQLKSGTFPLTPVQQSLVDMTQQAVKDLQEVTSQEASLYIQSAQTLGAATGIQRFQPTLQTQNLSASIIKGRAAIVEAELKGTKALADLQEGFQKDNFDLITKGYDAFTAAQDKKQTALEKLHSDIATKTKDALAKYQADIKIAQEQAKEEYTRQEAAKKFAVDNGITKPFYLLGNTAVNTATGEKVDLATYQKLTGQKVGLPENQTDFSFIQGDYGPDSKPISLSDGSMLVDPKTGKIIANNPKTFAPGSGSPGSPGSGPGGSLTDWDILSEAVSNKLSSVTSKKSFLNQFAKAKTDDQKIKILANNVVLPNEIKTGIIQNAQVTKSLDDVFALLDKGVQTGLLQAEQSYIANKLGTGGDKEVEQIKSKLVAALQPYRNKVTGAAWGEQEEQEYQTLIGSVRFTPEDLRNKLETFKDTLKEQSQTALLAGIDPLGAINMNSSIGDELSLGGESIKLQDPKTGEVRTFDNLSPQDLEDALNQGFIKQ